MSTIRKPRVAKHQPRVSDGQRHTVSTRYTGHARVSGAWIEADTLEAFLEAERQADAVHVQMLALVDEPARVTP